MWYGVIKGNQEMLDTCVQIVECKIVVYLTQFFMSSLSWALILFYLSIYFVFDRLVTYYAEDESKFFEDFSAAYIKLVNSGAKWSTGATWK